MWRGEKITDKIMENLHKAPTPDPWETVEEEHTVGIWTNNNMQFCYVNEDI